MDDVIKAIIVGILVVIIGSIVGGIIGRYFSVKLPAVCKSWNKNHVMELSLFLTGFLLFFLCKYTGLNKVISHS